MSEQSYAGLKNSPRGLEPAQKKKNKRNLLLFGCQYFNSYLLIKTVEKHAERNFCWFLSNKIIHI